MEGAVPEDFDLNFMKKIAIFASGSGEATERIVSLFNEGNRIRVELVVTDRENAEIIERLQPLGITVMYVPREQWHETPEQLLAQLKEKGIELIAFDDFRGTVPVAIEESFSGKTVTLTTPEESPREVVNALNKLDVEEETPKETSGQSSEPVVENTADAIEHAADNGGSTIETSEENTTEESPKTVDEEWADTLKIEFDPSRLRSTPPPVPGAQQHAPEIPHQQTAQKSYAGSEVNYAQQPASQKFGYKPHEHAIQPDAQEPMPPTYLIWSVITTVLCCFIPGIVAIVFSSQVSSRYLTGDIEGAKRASNRAQIWIIVSFVLGLLSSTLYLPIMLIS